MTSYFIGKETFNCPLIMEGSWGERDIGTHESTMELYFNDDATGFIEWDIEDVGFEHIGLWFTIDPVGVRTLDEYDGVMCLSDKAIALLRKFDVIVPKEFE
jgi:hypothetical protein